VTQEGNFIHTITIPEDMKYLPQHLILVLPRAIKTKMQKQFVEDFILKCSEEIKPWGLLTIRRHKSMREREVKDEGFVKTVVQIKMEKSSTR